jgi:hypothetical protein
LTVTFGTKATLHINKRALIISVKKKISAVLSKTCPREVLVGLSSTLVPMSRSAGLAAMVFKFTTRSLVNIFAGLLIDRVRVVCGNVVLERCGDEKKG